jgi:putative ABC transport system permease protein
MQRLTFFLRFMSWFSARHLRKHPVRVLAVMFGIALGAAVFTSVRLAVYASLDSFTRAMDLVSGKADWTVVRPGGRVPDVLVARLLSHPAVEAASPLLTSYVSSSQKESEPFLMIGLDPILDQPLRQWEIDPSSGQVSRIWLDLIATPYTIVTSRRLAREQGLSPGSKVTLEHVNQIKQFRLAGLLEEKGLSLVEGGYVALSDISTMQEFTGLQGWVDRIDLRVKPGANKKDLAEIRALLPPGIVLRAPTETRDSGRAMINAYQMNLSVLSFVSLFVGMFLVYSLVSLNAASRRHELAILRSLGASSRMIFIMILSEGFILGISGWLLAIPLGSVFVKYLVKGVSSTITNLFVRVHVETIQLSFWEILLSFLVTLTVSLLAAYKPAHEATHIPPREAMTTLNSPRGRRRPARHFTLMGLLLIGLTWPVAKLPGPPGFPFNGYAAVLFLVVGFSLLSLPVLQWMGSHLPSFLRRVAGEPGFLAARYVRDVGERASISVGALITAMALFVALVIMVHSFRDSVSLWVNQTLAGDFFVRPKMAGINQYQDSLPKEVISALKRLENVEIFPYRHIELRYGRFPYQFEAIPFDVLLRHGKFLMISGSMKALRERLIQGQGVLVSEVFANQTGLTPGERYRATFGQATLDLPVLGVFRDYRTQGGLVYFELKRFQDLTGDRQWSGVRLFFTDHHLDRAEATQQLRSEILKRCGQKHSLEMISGSELRKGILQIFDQTFAVTTVLLLIALLVAGLGITTTLTVLVLERIRQLNTLSAIGADRGQIRSMIFWEALLMVMAGESIGLVCGFLMSYLLIFVVNLESFGWTFLFRVDWSSLALSVPAILATALLAALPAVGLVTRSSPALVLKET